MVVSGDRDLFFGGMFCAYLIYRLWYFLDFNDASSSLDITRGTVNTAVFICSPTVPCFPSDWENVNSR